MMIERCIFFVLLMIVLINESNVADGLPHQILVDTDADVDDMLALTYLLKLDRSLFDLQAITINMNSWTSAGHAVNQVYDFLYMMGRDDIDVGIGGEGGILQDGTISPNVGGYLPIIEQGNSTSGYCRYSQVIPLGPKGKLDIDTKYGYRKSFLPQGDRSYHHFRQRTTQQVMIDAISKGPTTVFILGASTNFAIFLMSNPHLKKNIRHVYISGGGVRPRKPTLACCNNTGNVYTGYNTDPNAEYNMFMDPFAAYQVIHSGIPITLVSLDATDTIPITNEFLQEFEKNQNTYEAQFCFNTLKMVRDTWFNEQFDTIFFMWDSFLAGVATSIMLKENNINGENDFSEMMYMNITVTTSNEPYGTIDGSNPLSHRTKLKLNEIHTGHVLTGAKDTFCIDKNDGCKDGVTAEVSGSKGVRVLVAVNAKPNTDNNTSLDGAFYKNFLDVLNKPQQKGRFNFTTECRNYKEVLYKPDFKGIQLGKNVVFDMDMSAGDFLALFYLLKVPVQKINLKAILVSPTGWATAATIDVIYDMLHMMGRDDIPVGLGDFYALGQTYPNFESIGDCKYRRVIPQGSGGLIDSDTLYGLLRKLPRSPRRYTSENSIKFGAYRDTDHPELRQPLALEVWKSVVAEGSKVTILTNGPLTNVAKITNLEKDNPTSVIEEIVIVGGNIKEHENDKGNVINIPTNEYSELNMFLDPVAAKQVFDSGYNITLIPLNVQRSITRKFGMFFEMAARTPEANFASSLLEEMSLLKIRKPELYNHVDIFMREILGAVVLADDSLLKTRYTTRKLDVLATGVESEDGQMVINDEKHSSVNVVESVNLVEFYRTFADRLGDKNQSAVIGSYAEQKNIWCG